VGVEPLTLRNAAPPERRGLFFGYFSLVVVHGALAFASQAHTLPHVLSTAPLGFWLMAGFAVLVDARPFSAAPGGRDRSVVYPSICFTFAIMLCWGFAAAVVVQSAAVLVVALRMRHAPWRAAFNVGQYALSFAAAAAVLHATRPHPLASGGGNWVDLVVILGSAAAWFTVNHLLVATAIWLRFGGSWWRLVYGALGQEALATGALLTLAPVLTVAAHTNAALIPLVFVPLYAVERMARLGAEQQQAALRDPLTGLANRKALLTEVSDQVAVHAERAVDGAGAQQLALLLLDLDRFKHVNDALGHGVGDRLLVAVADRLRSTVPSGGFVARLGGDEFAIVAPDLVDGVASAQILAQRVVVALDQPVLLDGLPLDVGGSIGIAVYPDHGSDFAALMRHADVAMYDAKHSGDSVAVYQPESDHNSPERLSLLADLRRALETPGSGEITLYYQPQVELTTGKVIAVEALLRWHHPQRGPVNPDEVIRVAEHTAVMRLLTRRVIDDVVAQVAKWSAEGLALRASLNVSVRDLHTGEIVSQLASRLRESGVAAEQLQLEITEGALMADPHRVLATIARVSALGVAISLDDFGTGYSSLQHLRRLPLTEVKVDRSFVLGMAEDTDDAAIVRSTIELAGALGLRVVAEGVEDERTWQLLSDAGCEVAQGWFFARPMPGEDLVPWLGRYRAPRRAWLPDTRVPTMTELELVEGGRRGLDSGK
jgi:diguanylate cyclase (GGDEF)-like protein